MFEGDMSSDYNQTQEAMDKATKKYFQILNTISLGFESYIKLMDVVNPKPDEYKKKLTKKFDDGFKLFHKYFYTLND